MNNKEKPMKPVLSLRCRYCGHVFFSDDYVEEFNRASNRFEIREECPLCYCPCYPVDKQVM